MILENVPGGSCRASTLVTIFLQKPSWARFRDFFDELAAALSEDNLVTKVAALSRKSGDILGAESSWAECFLG